MHLATKSYGKRKLTRAHLRIHFIRGKKRLFRTLSSLASPPSASQPSEKPARRRPLPPPPLLDEPSQIPVPLDQSLCRFLRVLAHARTRQPILHSIDICLSSRGDNETGSIDSFSRTLVNSFLAIRTLYDFARIKRRYKRDFGENFTTMFSRFANFYDFI